MDGFLGGEEYKGKKYHYHHLQRVYMYRSPGLVVKGGDSSSRGREFESWCWILDGIFSHKCVFILTGPKINKKRPVITYI